MVNPPKTDRMPKERERTRLDKEKVLETAVELVPANWGGAPLLRVDTKQVLTMFRAKAFETPSAIPGALSSRG